MTRLRRYGLLLALLCGLPLLLVGSGCNSGLVKIDETTEVDIGRQGMADIEQQYRVVSDTPEARRVERIGQQVAAVSQRPKLPWSFKVIEMKDVNAFALPGGPIYVTTGLLDLKVSDDELAGVLGHEAAHINQRHSAKAIEQAITLGIISEIALGRADERTRAAADLAVKIGLELPHSRSAEYESDALGVRLAYNAGYPTTGLVSFLKRLQELTGANETPEWVSSHPAMKARVERTSKIAAEVAGLQRPVPIALSEYDKQVIKNLPAEK